MPANRAELTQDALGATQTITREMVLLGSGSPAAVFVTFFVT